MTLSNVAAKNAVKSVSDIRDLSIPLPSKVVMGLGASSYKMSVGRNLDWVADPTSKIFPIKQDAFSHVTGLGKGKFGIVFLAKQTIRDSNLHVAIKYIPKQTIFESQMGSKMQQEILALQKCEHPFITHCFGGFETTHCIALVLEFAYGGELFHRLQQVHRMGEHEAKFYFCELASALHYLHDELSIVYRDLKPENVLIDKEGHVRLCDFSFATEITAGPNGGATPLQDGCGTVMFMAPELVGNSKKAFHSFPVDWWALGCVLTELITGDAPFGNSEHMSKFEIFNRISESPPSLPLLMGLRLKTLLKGLLDKSESSRYSFEQVAKSAWLKEVNWDDLENRRIRPPWIPSADSITPAAPNFISRDNLALPTGNVGSSVLAYCEDIQLPVPRSSSLAFGKKTGSSSKGAAAAGLSKPGATGRLGRQNSRKVGPTDGEGASAGMVLDSPATEKARRRPDSIMVAKERSKGQMSGEAFVEATGSKVADSVKLQRERSKARINTVGDFLPTAPISAKAKTQDSVKLQRERSKVRINTGGDSSPSSSIPVSSKTMTKTQDSVKLQRERSKAAMKREQSTIKE